MKREMTQQASSLDTPVDAALVVERPATRSRVLPDIRRMQIIAEIVGSIVIALAGLRYFLLYFNKGTNLLDEGFQVALAGRILDGQLIYRDFLALPSPGSFYTIAWLMQMFGQELIVVRWAVVVIGLGILLATLATGRLLMSWPFAAAAALLTVVWGWFYVAANFYSWEAMLAGLLALLAFLLYMRTERWWWIFLAGLITGATLMVKQNIGVYTGLALVGALWISLVFETGGIRATVFRRLRATLILGGGAALVVLPVLVWLFVAGAGPYLYENWWYYPQYIYPQGLSLPYPELEPMLPKYPTLMQAAQALNAGKLSEPESYLFWLKLLAYLPALVYPFALLMLVGFAIRLHVAAPPPALKREAQTLLAVALFGILTFLQAWPRSDETHILFGMQPGYILLGYISFCLWRGLIWLPDIARRAVLRLRFKSLGYIVAAVLLVLDAALLVPVLLPQASLLKSGIDDTAFRYQNFVVELQTPRGRGIFTIPIEEQRIDGVSSYIVSHTAPGDPIFVVPWAAGLYFLTDRPNPTRYDLLYDGAIDHADYPALIQKLEQTKPNYIVYGYAWDVDGKKFSDYARPIDQYIRSHYRIETRIADYEIWRRIP